MAEKSAIKEALQKLETQLECSICLDTYKEPKTLPCFHVFCKSPCLEGLVVKDKQQQSLRCPTCNHHVCLLEGGVSGLQSAFLIDSLFEIQDTLTKAEESTDTQCANCNDGKVKIYCDTCGDLVCTDCAIRFHKSHNYDLVEDVFPKHKEEIVFNLKSVKEKLDIVNQALQELDTRAEEISENKVVVEADINWIIDQQQRFLDQQRVELSAKLDSLTQQMLKSLEVHRDHVEFAKVKLVSCLEYVEGNLETGTEGNVLAMKTLMLECIHQINAEFDPAIIQPEKMAGIQLTGCKQLVQKAKEYLKILEGETPIDDQITAVVSTNSQADINNSEKDSLTLAVSIPLSHIELIGEKNSL